MKFLVTFPVSVVVGASFFLMAASASAQPAQAGQSAPTSPLRLGDKSAEVVLLQKLLNTSADTQVAQVGPGSPGMESDYFGTKTLDAVKRFQEKHKAEILIPAGLLASTGFVGKNTLLALRAGALAQKAAPKTPSLHTSSPVATTSLQAIASLAASASSTPSQGPVPLYPNMPIPAGVNPNSINLEYFISDIQKVGKQNGYSDADLKIAEQAIRDIAATTTNLHQEFFTQFKKKSAFNGVFYKGLSFLGLGSVAQAQTAAIPFGGRVLFVSPCPCSKSWLVKIQPLPPTYPVLLTAYTGTQLFLSYNVPFTALLLGFYFPVGICLVPIPHGCATIPSQGHITPFVGSSILMFDD